MEEKLAHGLQATGETAVVCVARLEGIGDATGKAVEGQDRAEAGDRRNLLVDARGIEDDREHAQADEGKRGRKAGADDRLEGDADELADQAVDAADKEAEGKGLTCGLGVRHGVPSDMRRVPMPGGSAREACVGHSLCRSLSCKNGRGGLFIGLRLAENAPCLLESRPETATRHLRQAPSAHGSRWVSRGWQRWHTSSKTTSKCLSTAIDVWMCRSPK